MINCCCIDVDDPAEVEVVEMIRARKQWTCCECGEKIQPCAQYERAKLLYDGQWSVYETCLPCAGIRRDFLQCGHYYERLCEDIRECLGFDYLTGEDLWEDEEG